MGWQMSSTYWITRDWIEFNEVLHEEGCGLFTSRREAERMLRKLCASGVIQTVRFHQDGAKIVPEFIQPKEHLGAMRVPTARRDSSPPMMLFVFRSSWRP